MDIKVSVDDISLQTIVATVYGRDEDGDRYEDGHETLGSLVAAQLVAVLVKDNQWPALRAQVIEIRAEVIREQVTPVIEAALAKPLRKTNSYGEPTGTETTLAELIAAEANKQLTQVKDTYNRGSGSLVQQLIAAEVQKAFATEIADAVKQARDMVAKQIGETASSQITAAAMKALTSK